MLDKKPATIGGMFDRIAPSYDRINRILSLCIDRTWRKKAVQSLDIGSGDRILDIATGTGDLALDALQADPACTVVGIDLSREMIARGIRKSRLRGFSRRFSFVNGDALALPFKDATMNRAMVAFGIRNMSNRTTFLDELNRILTDDGRAAILEFSLPENRPVRLIYLAYFQKLLPLVGTLLSGHPGAYRYLTESVLDFPSPEELSNKMRERGFNVVSLRRLSFGIVHLYLLHKKSRSKSGFC